MEEAGRGSMPANAVLPLLPIHFPRGRARARRHAAHLQGERGHEQEGVDRGGRDDGPRARDHRHTHRDRLHRADSREGYRGRYRDPCRRSAPDQGAPGRVRAHDVRSRLHEHRVVQERDHLHRRRQGHPALSRLSDRAARREGELPRGRVAAAQRRAAHAAGVRRLGARHHVPHVRAREHQDVSPGLSLRRAPDVDAVQRRRGAVELLSEGEEHPGSGGAAHQHRAPARQAADARRVLLPPREGPALHLSRQRSRLRREFPLDGRADVGAEVRGEPGVREGARGAVHPPRRPRAELLDERRARRRLARTSIRSRRSPPASPRCTARCTAARTSRCCA